MNDTLLDRAHDRSVRRLRSASAVLCLLLVAAPVAAADGAPGLANAVIRALPVAAGLVGLVGVGWLLRRPFRRAWEATGSTAPPQPWGLAQVLRHLFGVPLVLGGAAGGVYAWHLLQQPGLYEQKIGWPLAAVATAAVLLGAVLLAASHRRAIARPALLLMIVMLVGLTLAELYYGYL